MSVSCKNISKRMIAYKNIKMSKNNQGLFIYK